MCKCTKKSVFADDSLDFYYFFFVVGIGIDGDGLAEETFLIRIVDNFQFAGFVRSKRFFRKFDAGASAVGVGVGDDQRLDAGVGEGYFHDFGLSDENGTEVNAVLGEFEVCLDWFFRVGIGVGGCGLGLCCCGVFYRSFRGVLVLGEPQTATQAQAEAE